MAAKNPQRPRRMKIEGPDIELLAGSRITHWENFSSIQDAFEHAGNLPSYSTAILIEGPGGKRVEGADQFTNLWVKYRLKKWALLRDGAIILWQTAQRPAAVVLITLITAVFSSLTVEVNEKEVRWHFSLGDDSPIHHLLAT